jgi:hypothetical protein
MKNQLVFTCFLILFGSANAFSQSDFAAIGTQWTYTQWVSSPNPAIGWRYPYYMKADSEVVFQGRLCRRLIGGRAGQPQLPLFYVYNEGDSVICWDWENERFNLLYDFSAETGDSWEIPMPSGFSPFGDTSIIISVDSTSQTVINNDTLKVWHISYDEFADWSSILIEHIGSTCFFIPRPDLYESNICVFRRFENSVMDFNFVNYPCDSIITTNTSSSENPTEAEFIKIYPNPASDRITVECPFGIGETLYLELFDLSGKRVHFESCKNDGSLVFDLSNMASGFYSIRITGANKAPGTRKWVVIK